MKKVLFSVVAVFISAALSVALVGCGGQGAGSADSGTGTGTDSSTSSGGSSGGGESVEAELTPEEVLGLAEVAWGPYTMSFELVSDGFEEVGSSTTYDFQGKALKVCFAYLADTANSGGFVHESMFDNLAAYPITLRDAEGVSYPYTGYIGDISISGGQDDIANLQIDELQPRFSIDFDVPADSKVEDFVIVFGNGEEYQLATYISEAYNKVLAD